MRQDSINLKQSKNWRACLLDYWIMIHRKHPVLRHELTGQQTKCITYSLKKSIFFKIFIKMIWSRSFRITAFKRVSPTYLLTHSANRSYQFFFTSADLIISINSGCRGKKAAQSSPTKKRNKSENENENKKEYHYLQRSSTNQKAVNIRFGCQFLAVWTTYGTCNGFNIEFIEHENNVRKKETSFKASLKFFKIHFRTVNNNCSK